MNSFEFLKELNDIDDDLLMKAEVVPNKKHRIVHWSLRAAAAAALISLAVITVAAVTIGVHILTSDATALYYDHYYGGFPFGHNSKVTTVGYELEPQAVQIPQNWTQELTERWKAFGYDYDHFSGIDLTDVAGSRVSFGGITQLEQLLQIRFTSSSELEAVTQGAYVTLAITDHERAAVQYRSEGIVSPDGIVIYLPFSRDSESGVDPNIVNYCGLSIFVPLTDSFARQYASHSVLSSVYNSDFQQIRQVSSGGVEMILLENEPYMDYPLSGYAAWEERGIGYLVELKCNNGSRTAPIEILMPYLENLEG